MPVLLRATGAGRQPASSHRPQSQLQVLESLEKRQVKSFQQQSSLPLGQINRRVSQLSVTPSVQTGQTVLQVHPHQVRRTVTSSTTQQSTKPQTLLEKFRAAVKRFQLKRLFPLVVILIYMLIGALLFWLIESGEDDRKATENVESYKLAREMLWRRIDEIVWENRNMTTKSLSMRRPARKKLVAEAVDHFQKTIGYAPKQGYGWDFMSSMYFAGTLFTTIGYGDIACITSIPFFVFYCDSFSSGSDSHCRLLLDRNSDYVDHTQRTWQIPICEYHRMC